MDWDEVGVPTGTFVEVVTTPSMLTDNEFLKAATPSIIEDMTKSILDKGANLANVVWYAFRGDAGFQGGLVIRAIEVTPWAG